MSVNLPSEAVPGSRPAEPAERTDAAPAASASGGRLAPRWWPLRVAWLRDDGEGADGGVPHRTSIRTIAAGIVLGSLALWLAFRGLDLEELRQALARVDPAWTLAALVSKRSSGKSRIS